jgi:multidrug efflux pump subunit AcrA (membrane-fusion protein)
MISVRMAVLAIPVCAAVAGCKDEKNAYYLPSPPMVGVAKPLHQPVNRYFEATGNATPVNSIDLIARVAGTIFQLGFTDGQTVKKGDELFIIDPAPFQVRLVQAQAAPASAQATLGNNDAELSRQNQLGAVAAVTVTPTVGPALISPYNLYPSAQVIGNAAGSASSGQALDLRAAVAGQSLPPGTGYEWSAMSYQEKAVGSLVYVVFGLAMLLV